MAEDIPGVRHGVPAYRLALPRAVRPADRITAEVEVIGLRDDKPVATLHTTSTHDGWPHGPAIVHRAVPVRRHRSQW
jgi:hypothetical protein